jgi:DNA-binding MarR family transcriptional regulator
MTKMPKLTDTQLVILNTAAARDGHAILPLPKSLKVNKGTATSVLKAMLAKGLIKEQPTHAGDEPWRKDEEGHGFILTLTDAGLAALDSGDTDQPTKIPRAPGKATPKSKKAAAGPGTPTHAPARGGKAETILALVSRPGGARIADLQKATGWQPHSVRAALTGLRKRGIDITRAKEGDATVYHAKAA